jgi:hypothetical protein
MHKAVNYDKSRDITQGKDEYPKLYLGRLTGVLRKYTGISPDSTEGQTLWGMSFYLFFFGGTGV